jgi:acetyl-CoA carboxylase biotin carboxyl carrier protein
LTQDIDAKLVRKLADLLDETGLGELEYSIDNWKIRVAKPTIASSTLNQNIPNMAEINTGEAALEQKMSQGLETLKSPMVGTAYLTPDPDTPPFVDIGSSVKEGDIVLIIEAMKVMNPIPAHQSGTVRQILIGSGDPVEFGQPIMVID